MATNPYNQPNAVTTAGFKTYNAKDVKAGKINPYEDYGASTRASALSDQKLAQANTAAADAKQKAADVAAQVAQKKADEATQKAQKIKDSQPKKSTASKVLSAIGGVGKGTANVVGGVVVGGAEAINKGIVSPYISAPAGAVGAAAADATSGKGFDYRKQYHIVKEDKNTGTDVTGKQISKFVDKSGTNLTGSVDYADQHTKEILATTGLVLADIGTGGALTPVVAPALTGYYAPKYAKSVVPTIKAMQAEPDIGKKFTMGTELLGQALLLAKGAKDTVTSVKGLPEQVRGIPTTKEVNVGGKVPNEQARSFFNSSNPDITPETSSLLGKALADNKAQFVSELKAGKGVTVENIQTVPTVYGKLINIIKGKMDKGQKLTPNEEGVVHAVANDPAMFVKTKEMVPYDAAKAQENAVPPAAGVTPIAPPIEARPAEPPAVIPAPDLTPIELPPGLAHPAEVPTAPVAVAPTVNAPAPAKGALKPIKPAVVKPKGTGTITTYSGHQGRGSAFSTTDKQFATQFANEDVNGNPVKGVVTTKKINKADVLDTRNTEDRAKLESILGQENVTKMIDESGQGLPAHVDKGEQDALVAAAKQLGYKHIALSETDNQSKYNGSHVVSYVDTSPEVTSEVSAPAKGSPKKPAHIAQGEAEAAKMKESDVLKEIDRKLASYAEGKADLAAFTRHASNMGGTFGNFHGSYDIGTPKQNVINVTLGDGRKFSFKMSDVFNRLKKPEGSTVKPEHLESNRTAKVKGAVKPLGKKATVEIKYPATDKLPVHLKDKAPLDMKKLQKNGEQAPKEKLTPREANIVAGADINWNKSKLSELVRLVPGLKEKPILTVYKDSEGNLQLHGGANDKSQTFRIPAESMGLSQARIEASGLKEGDTVDLGGVLEKGGGQVPVIKKGKTMFSGTAGGNKAAPKPAAEPEAPPAEEPAAPAAKPSNPIKKFMDETAKNKDVAGRLDDQLHALGGNSVADNIALSHLFKEVKNLKVKPEDWTAVYHYAEDRNATATPEQKALYDTTIKPLQDSMNKMREDMGLKPFKNDEFIHRIAQGRGSSLERFLEGDNKDISPGNVLKKTSDSMKTRTWMKIVDPNDPTSFHIVSIKSPKNKLGKALGERQVTAWTYGKKQPMGALKRKIPDPVHEFYDPKVMEQLNEIAKGLGIEHTRTNLPLKRGDTAAGVSYGGTNQVKTKAASPADALLHEIGHQIDEKYGLQEQFFGGSRPKSDMIIDNQISKLERLMGELKPGKDDAIIADYKQLIQQHLEQKTINTELRDLADKRYEGFNPENRGVKSFQKYVRTGEEKMAVMFQAYLHAPEIFKAVAPVTYDKFNNFLQSNPETKPIANIKKSLILGSDKVGDVRHEGEFIDKTGKKWKIVNATTKEIEANSNTRYYKQPLVSTAIDYMQTRQALRASQFLDKWKESPDFLYQEHSDGSTTGIAVKSDAKTIPEGWKTTTAPQFRGYYFEPRTAEVLDDFARTAAKGDPLGAFTGMNLFLRNTIFFNPLMHVPNIMWHAVMRRGVSGIANPIRAVRGVSSSVQAINELVHKGELYQAMLREGAPLMSFDRGNLSKMIGKMMEDTIQDDHAVTTIAKLAGYASKANFIKAWYKVSSGVTWGSHDFFMLQAMIEEMKHGLTPQEAIHEVTAHIPDYRLPTRFAGSRSLKTTLSNKNVTMFLPYHYGIFKSYANTVREISGYAPRGGRQESGWAGRAKTSAKGIDKLIMFGVIALLIYPEMDKLAKKITGDDNAIQRRAGPFTFPYAIYRMLGGHRTIQSTATLVLPTPPGTKGLIQLLRNRDDLNRQIWNPGEAFSNPVQAAKDIGHFALGTIAPAQQAQRAAEGKLDAKGFVNTLLGISTPNDTKSLVSKLYGQQLNLGVQSKEQQRINQLKNDARDQIAAGQGDSKAKQLVSDGVLKESKLKDFEATAKWTPMQRTFDNLTAVNKLQVLQKSSPKDWPQLGDLNQIKKDAAKTAKDKNASDANRTAAGDIEKVLSGDTSNLMYSNGQQTTNKSVISSIGAYASAFKTSPLTAFNRIFTGQRIIRTNNGAIIVERMPVSSSQAVKGKLGGKNASMKLDHTVPLELGGTNAESNLKLVPTDTWASYTPVEDYLGKQLAANKISAKDATRKIVAFKNGSMKASEIIGH